MLKADKAALAAALAAVSPAIKAKNTIPVLQNVLIAREGNHFIARGGNMDVELSATFDAVAAPDFIPFTCPVQTFAEFVKRAPDSTITVDAVIEAGRLEHVNLRSGRSRLKQPILPADTFPKLDAGNLTHRVTLDADILAAALSSVSHAVSSDQTQVFMCGVFVEGSPDGLNIVATDRYRIERRLVSAMSFDPDDPFATIPPTIVPADTVSRILKLAADAEDLTLGFARERLTVTAGGVTLISKLIDAQFPDWNAITRPARDNGFTARFSRPAMADAVERVLIATPDSSKGMTFAFADGAVTLAARDFRSGEGEDQIPAEADLELTIAFNGKYLREALAGHHGDQVELLLARATSNSILHPAGKPDDFTLLIPMKIPGITL
jgi:DNA polymerase III subunit beta